MALEGSMAIETQRWKKGQMHELSITRVDAVSFRRVTGSYTLVFPLLCRHLRSIHLIPAMFIPFYVDILDPQRTNRLIGCADWLAVFGIYAKSRQVDLLVPRAAIVWCGCKDVA